MTQLPIAFRTNESKYSFLGQTRVINGYAEKQDKDAKAPLAVLPCDGMLYFLNVSDSPCRGMIYLEDADAIYSVHNSSVFKITYDGTTATTTYIGVIPGADVVQLSRNQATATQISIHCDAGEYYIENDLVKSVTDVDLPTPIVSQDHLSGYTIYGLEDRRFFLSGLNTCQDIDALDFATAEQSSDPLTRVKADRGNLFVFKQRNTEIWRNTGAADFPLEPMPSMVGKGLPAANAVMSFDSSLVWPADDNVVYRLNGTVPQRISDHGIERLLQNDADRTTVIGFPHGSEGHAFATLTGSNWTRSYDNVTGVWHTRESYRLDHWRARFPVRAWGKTIVGDELTGYLYELSSGYFLEGGNPLIWGIDSPILHVFPNGGIVDALHIDVATGNGTLNDLFDNPKLMLSWSVDGGATFIGNRELSIGAYGDRVRVTTRRLGRFGPKGMQFRIRVSDPVIRALCLVDVAVRKLRR